MFASSRSTLRLAFVASAVTFAAASACVPHRDVPVQDIPKLGNLEEVMDVQATVADPQFKKIGQETYSDVDFAAFADVSSRLQATSAKVKDFTKGPGFDALADRLRDEATTLGTAASAKNAKGSSDALAAMKATCKECHKSFR
jgi:cytochrome c556